MKCRANCGACCVAASITSAIPNMPLGKPAGMRCVNLDSMFRCQIWGTPDYPEVCRDFIPGADVCGINQDEALRLITEMEVATTPS